MKHLISSAAVPFHLCKYLILLKDNEMSVAEADDYSRLFVWPLIAYCFFSSDL